MLKTVDKEVGAIQPTQRGLLPRKTALDLQCLVIYYSTRTGMSAMRHERRERRAYFADKHWKRYKQAILRTQKEKEERLARFT